MPGHTGATSEPTARPFAAILSAIFDELELTRMEYGEGALRLGVLYDLVGRVQQTDMRRVSVEQMMRRISTS